MPNLRKDASDSHSTVSVRSSYFDIEPRTERSDQSTIVADTASIIEISSDESFDRRRKNYNNSTYKCKVSTSVQADRNIIGQEHSSSRERPGWIRPPVLGQASSNEDTSAVKLTTAIRNSSESEEEIKPKISIQNESTGFIAINEAFPNRMGYTSDKPMEGSSDHSLPPFTELQDFQRASTPPSSISSTTPKPLEWDSGADVGYFQAYGGAQNMIQQLSTIERMALDQGRSGYLVRSEPEGRTSSNQVNQANSSVIKSIGVPTSESTPLLNSDSNKLRQKTSKLSKNRNKQKYVHLFPEVIIETKGNQSDSSIDGKVSSKKPMCNTFPNTSDRKLSTSLENLGIENNYGNQAATFPRSQSQLNLASELNSDASTSKQGNNPPQSVSSSSLATVVTGSPKKTSKLIQTLNKVDSHCSEGNKKGNDREQIHSNRKRDNNDSSTLESIQMSTGDRVNSFEYLPGHVYENVQNPDQQLKTWEHSEGLSLRNDVERGVHILEEFIQGSNANNTLKKKELIKRVVNRLIHTEYPDDSDSINVSPQRCSTRRSQNRDNNVVESSSENISGCSRKVTETSSSLTGKSTSTTWESASESTKSSDASLPNQIDKNKVENRTSGDPKKKIVDKTSYSKSNWKAPTTLAEKLYEQRKKDASKDNSCDEIVDFLNSERKNQLDWIVKEINHLSNLKTLLEKHERLRRNLNKLKKVRQKNITTLEDEIKPTGHSRTYGFRRRPPYNTDENRRVPPTYTKVNTQRSKLIEENAWDSHNYETDAGGRLKKTVSTETRKEDFQGGLRSTAYTITFEPSDKPKEMLERNERQNPVITDRQTLAKKSRELVRETYQLSSLQDYLITRRPDIVARAESRRKTVAELCAVRQLREEKRPVILAAALSCDTGLVDPPPPSLVKRVVSQKEMRQQTERKYRQTFEVKKKVSAQKLKESKKTNQLMKDIFNKRLQMLTLKGHTDLSNSFDVISTV